MVPAKQRDAVFDVAKGLGILAMLGIHCSNNSARLYTDAKSWGWWSLVFINRFCNFAVPLFLLLSAVLYAKSFSSKPDWKGFYSRRLVGVAWPYLVWSLLYMLFRMAKEPSPEVSARKPVWVSVYRASFAHAPKGAVS